MWWSAFTFTIHCKWIYIYRDQVSFYFIFNYLFVKKHTTTKFWFSGSIWSILWKLSIRMYTIDKIWEKQIHLSLIFVWFSLKKSSFSDLRLHFLLYKSTIWFYIETFQNSFINTTYLSYVLLQYYSTILCTATYLSDFRLKL